MKDLVLPATRKLAVVPEARPMHGGLDPEALVAGLPSVTAADPRDVTDLLAGLAGLWASAMRRPAPSGIPALRAFQRRFHRAAWDWVLRRTVLGPA